MSATTRFIRMQCSCCEGTNTHAQSHLVSKISYLIENKLPWYAWNNEWVKDIKFNTESQLLEDILKGIASTTPNLETLLCHNHFQWACDVCIDAGKAIDADISIQKFSTHPPYLAYFDKELLCESCKRPFTFTKHEQKYWYEDLNFWVQSIPKNCLECRKEKRQQSQINRQLQSLLKALNMNDSEQLISISRLYMELDNVAKAKHYDSLATKKRGM